MKEAIYSRTVIHILLIIVLGLIAYSNTIHVPFHFDDMDNIIQNVKLGYFNNFWPPSGTRWFGDLTFAINYRFGGLDVTGYHIVNLVIHIFNAILVYWLVALTFKCGQRLAFSTPSLTLPPRGGGQGWGGDSELQTQNPPSPPFSKGGMGGIALFSALLFVAHPIQTESVTYIVQRFTILSTFFYLLSVVMYIKFRMQDTGYKIQDTGCRLNATRYTLYAVSLISAVLAMKTKEISFTLPFIITLYEFMFFAPLENSHFSNGVHGSRITRRILYLIPFLLTLLIIPLSMSGINKPLGDVISELKGYTAETDAIDRWSYLFTQFRVIVTYLRLLFLPINQNLIYDYPVYRSFLNPNVFLSFLFLLSIFGLGVYLFYRSRLKKVHSSSFIAHSNNEPRATSYKLRAMSYERLISFGIFWFFIALAVESSIIPIRHLIFEHRLYLPGIGAIMALSAAIFYVLQFIVHSSRFTVHGSRFLLAAIVITLSMATYQRNSLWSDEIMLWKDVVKKSPNGANAHNGLGSAYYRRGMLDKAIIEFSIALYLNPDYREAQRNLSLAYMIRNAMNSKGKKGKATKSD